MERLKILLLAAICGAFILMLSGCVNRLLVGGVWMREVAFSEYPIPTYEFFSDGTVDIFDDNGSVRGTGTWHSIHGASLHIADSEGSYFRWYDFTVSRNTLTLRKSYSDVIRYDTFTRRR